ncbi:resistance protein [Musa troglodytarum]|uniref:Resistance protein n=1 Tax=Musa troglodytarum TaxID=320322 RepID=A0A9E7GH49_9LILI|nr:resistance protein [Musa troglodytarum]
MIYHHPWVRQHFQHRIWVDVSIDLSFDPVSIGREFARCITGESCDHLQSHQAMWLLVNERLGQRRYLLILNDIYCDGKERLEDKWDHLKHNLLHVGGMGSTVIITTKKVPEHSCLLDTFGSKDYWLDGLSEEVWIKLVMREALIGSEQDKANTCSISLLLRFAEQQYQTQKGSPMLAKTLGSMFRYAEKLPSWMACNEENIRHLREVKLVNLRKCERLPPLGQLPGLKTVEISGMDSISAADGAFYGDGDGGTFPRLKSLIFSEMPTLERWVKAKGEGVLFPELTRLILMQCPRFKELRISGCEELRCLPPGIKHLEHLYHLQIIGCNNLMSLPDWLAEVTRVDPWRNVRIPFSLVVRDCAMLSFIPQRLKQSPYIDMRIEGCPKLEL